MILSIREPSDGLGLHGKDLEARKKVAKGPLHLHYLAKHVETDSLFGLQGFIPSNKKTSSDRLNPKTNHVCGQRHLLGSPLGSTETSRKREDPSGSGFNVTDNYSARHTFPRDKMLLPISPAQNDTFNRGYGC